MSPNTSLFSAAPQQGKDSAAASFAREADTACAPILVFVSEQSDAELDAGLDYFSVEGARARARLEARA